MQPNVSNAMSNLAGAQGTLAQQQSGFKSNSGANINRLINTGAGFLRDMYRNQGTGRKQYSPEELQALEEARMGSQENFRAQEYQDYSAPLFSNFDYGGGGWDGFDAGSYDDTSYQSGGDWYY